MSDLRDPADERTTNCGCGHAGHGHDHQHGDHDEHEHGLVEVTIELEDEHIPALDEVAVELTNELKQKWDRGAVVRLALSEFFSRRGKIT